MNASGIRATECEQRRDILHLTDALVAANVRAVRARRRLRQEDLADETGWSRQTVSTVEAGTRRVTLADAVALCAALQVDLRELLQGAPAEAFEALGIPPA